MECGVGLNQSSDLTAAIRQAAQEARDRLSGGSPHAALVVTAGEALPRAGAIVREVLGPIPIAGGASAGLLTDTGLVSHGVAVVCFRSEEWAIQSACAGSRAIAPVQAADRVARLILSGRPNRRRYPRGVAFAFGDSRVADGADQLTTRWREIMGTRLKNVGGLPAEARGLYCDAVEDPGPLSVLCLEGPGPVGVGVGLGWAPLTLTRMATRTEGCLLHELDGRPAARVYTESIPGSAEDPARFPLGLAAAEDQWLIRSVIGIEGSSLRLGGELPASAEVRFMTASVDGLQQASRDAVVTALKRLEGQPARALLVIESAGRLAVQNGAARREWETIREHVAPEIPCVGWLSAFELAPDGNGQLALQNGSVVVVAFA
jgi:hypothetical protein